MQQILKVQISENKEYLIEISDSSFAKLNQDIYEFTRGQKRLVIMSKKVYKLYSGELNFRDDEIFVLPDGEKEKNYDNYLKIMRRAIDMGLTSKDVIIAVGGGVVGDIAGFAASTYMRGIDFIQIPTTLLSAVDSSVGGKTAIDFGGIKNILGSFYQPKKVFININFLNTLDKKQFLSGMGEVIKYAFIEDSCGYKTAQFLFEFLTLGCDKIMQKDPYTLIRLIEYCLNLKISVVCQDEKESGLRKILNFGHTYGHAIEALGGYKKFTHGEAVVQGIYFIMNWAYKKELISYSYYRLSVELLEKYGFKPYTSDYPKSKLIQLMQHDKKSDSEKITFIIPTEKKQVKEAAFTPVEVECML